MNHRTPTDPKRPPFPHSPVAEATAVVTRRGFLRAAASLGASAALPLGLAACFGGSDEAPTVPAGARNLFFNLSHEPHAGRTYYLTGGGQRHKLVSVSEQPEVLQRERATNAFLAGVPDNQITHHVEGVVMPGDSVTICYVSTDLDVAAGTWSLTAVHVLIPPSAAQIAYDRARLRTPSGPLPLSAKRSIYGLPAAQSAQDLRDERALLDTASQAATFVGMHPDLLSLSPNSAHSVHSTHLDTNINVVLLAQRLQRPEYGPALPQQDPSRLNAQGFATLVPVVDDQGVPIRNTKGQHKGRIQYQPQWNNALHELARAAMNSSILTVKDDESLGADITNLKPPGPNDEAAVATALNGAIWLRRDGTTRVDQSAGTAATTAGGVTLSSVNSQAGFQVAIGSAAPSGNTFSVTLSVANWFLEYRGVYLQFLDAQDQPIALANVPEYGSGTIVANHDKSLDTTDALWIALVGPTFTLFGIPVTAGTTSTTFTLPAGASSVRVLSSVMSMQSNNHYPDTVVAASVMTGIFNYGVTIFMAAGGAAVTTPGLWKVLAPVAQAVALELTTIISGALANNSPKNLASLLMSPGFWTAQGLLLAKLLLSDLSKLVLREAIAYVLAAIGEGAAEDCIPIAGEIMQAVSIAVGVISLAETTAELALTPWTYEHLLVFTHDLSVSLQPDVRDNTFPKAANAYRLTALFDGASPSTQSFDLSSPGPQTLPPVVFKGVPFGGTVNVSVAFVQKSINPTEPDVLLGKGSTGPFANTVDTASITIEELAFPIGPSTRYQHRQKTTLDAGGQHVWTHSAVPADNLSTLDCGGPGTLCDFYSISVRQGTSTNTGYLGYSWKGFNDSGCIGGGAGQLDSAANLSTGNVAQDGYTRLACGIGQPGVKVVYGLVGAAAQNYYLDSSDLNAPMVRGVTLQGGSPAFASPLSNQSFGVLNFSSDTLLLHPQGHLVSINQSAHKIETLRLPKQALSDSDAKLQLVAVPTSGKGSRPGLINAPAAMAIGTDGVLLVLENGNNRIQALDLGGNPVRHFSQQKSPYALVFSATDANAGQIYIDMAVEFTGFIYVLSYDSTTSPYVYRLDIYHPDQAGSAPICTTQGINAARLSVDLWRNVYTLNYEVLRLPGGSTAATPEPSVSLWTPCEVGVTCS